MASGKLTPVVCLKLCYRCSSNVKQGEIVPHRVCGFVETMLKRNRFSGYLFVTHYTRRLPSAVDRCVRDARARPRLRDDGSRPHRSDLCTPCQDLSDVTLRMLALRTPSTTRQYLITSALQPFTPDKDARPPPHSSPSSSSPSPSSSSVRVRVILVADEWGQHEWGRCKSNEC